LRCFVCDYVYKKAKPVKLVVNDGDWSFLCGDELPLNHTFHSISLQAVLQIDPSVADVLDLPIGYEAERKDVGEPWFAVKSGPF